MHHDPERPIGWWEPVLFVLVPVVLILTLVAVQVAKAV